MAKKKAFIPCVPREATLDQKEAATIRAALEQPLRFPKRPTPGYLALDNDRRWPETGKVFTVAFINSASQATRDRILAHANAWGEFANVKFVPSATDPDIRIDFGRSGYWSYLGVDILGIPRNEPTMNLEGFTASTSEAEYRRVVRHEFGHTLGFPHEHMRQQLVNRLDPAKTIAYFKRYGWDAQTTREQVLTPLSEASIRGTPTADDTSIMCYQLPGSITKDGKPIMGGLDINEIDAGFVATVYPKQPLPPPPDEVDWPAQFSTEANLPGGKYRIDFTKL